MMVGRVPELSNWGAFGEEDQLGTLNYLTPEAVLRGVAAVRAGERYPLNLPLDDPSAPDRSAPAFKADGLGYEKTTYRNRKQQNGLVVNDDAVRFSTQGSSQWDALIHVGVVEEGVDGIFYNGAGMEAMDDAGLAHTNSIDQVARVGIAGRGVLLDVARHLTGGRADPLPLTHRITPAETEACMQAQGVTIEPGDVVCFRTGWAEAFMNASAIERQRLLAPVEGAPLPSVPGITPDHALMAKRQHWAAVVADNVGVEAIPMIDPRRSAHVRMMRNLGLLFGELLLLGDLGRACADERRWEFLFVAMPLWIPGGTGSPANAMALR
jgi:kynurenine formamidase